MIYVLGHACIQVPATLVCSVLPSFLSFFFFFSVATSRHADFTGNAVFEGTY